MKPKAKGANMFGFLWGYALGKSSNGKPDKGFGQIMVIVLLMFFIGGCIVFFSLEEQNSSLVMGTLSEVRLPIPLILHGTFLM